jgi:threonine dehydrogenase-like Zn-dependent dehydrogenase
VGAAFQIGAHPHILDAGPNAAAGNLVNTGPLITADLITHRIRFEDADAAYDLIDTAPETTIKVVLTYDQ